MIIYGLYGKSHGAAYALTLMSAAGGSAVASRILPGPDVLVEARVNQLPQYFENWVSTSLSYPLHLVSEAAMTAD